MPEEHRSQCDDKDDVETANRSGGGRPAGRQQGSGLKTHRSFRATGLIGCQRHNKDDVQVAISASWHVPRDGQFDKSGCDACGLRRVGALIDRRHIDITKAGCMVA